MAENHAQPAGMEAAVRDEGLQIVGFKLGDEDFAFDILEIVSIERLDNVLQLPKMPKFVEGVMRIRDEIVALVKLRTRFGLSEAERSTRQRVVVVEIGEETVGFIVDSVQSVRRVTKGQIEPAPPLALTEGSRFVKGVVRGDGAMTILLNPFEILFEHETRQLQSSMADAERRAAVLV
ncbi:MAG: purine-binding chemotaxis protein CheW [Acidobacteria bacterium]|nr:purine-binding chemotaxis protein CheW [Acidobacteriota bacterium]MCG3192212.1 Chemotaxis protein CheW [Thermoanaerobaculia bacterium]MCK6683517.1 chemotaxis protein CheW [Thermoanaerobaculia bacterium]